MFNAKINLNKLVVYDIETMQNLSVFCFLDIATKKKKEFIIYNDKKYEAQPLELYKFLKNLINSNYTFLGFNNLSFDAQITHSFYEWCTHKQDPLYELGNEFIIQQIYRQAQDIIEKQNTEQHYNGVYESKLFAPQIDLFKQLQLDRKKISLKWIEFSTRYHTIQEMPIQHNDFVRLEQVEDIVEYCWNDVYATAEFFEKVRFESEMRLALSKEYNINLINAHEAKIGREIFSKFLCASTGIQRNELYKLRTEREIIYFKDIIFPYISFITPELTKVLNEIKEYSVDASGANTTGFEYKFNLKGVDVILGLGGIHSCVNPSVYKLINGKNSQQGNTFSFDESEYRILDLDVTSMYPNIAIKNKLKPAHLPDKFTELYEDLFIQRQNIPKSDPKNYIMKIILNGLYGQSSEPNSYLFDKFLTYGITINGQLMILMLVEALYLSIPDIKIIQKNTDGVTFIHHIKYENKIKKVVDWWEKTTQLKLEDAQYKKMVVRDVNNYIAEYTNGELKSKGMFETDPPYYKNPSMNIIPKALEAYFIKGISIDEFFKDDNLTIFDFCLGVKKTKAFAINFIQNFGMAELITEQQKVCRYFVSKQNSSSGVLVKDFYDGRKISIMSKQYVQPLDVIPKDREHHSLYPINYSFYKSEINKWINIISPLVIKQSLF